ncbi:MAG: VanW family protein [Clostridia bacterium]|nr:VanW family protein [Clostridia bacterium]
MGFIKQLGLYDGDGGDNEKNTDTTPKPNVPEAPKAPGVTRDEFTAAAIRNLAAASEAAHTEEHEDDDFGAAPETVTPEEGGSQDAPSKDAEETQKEVTKTAKATNGARTYKKPTNRKNNTKAEKRQIKIKMKSGAKTSKKTSSKQSASFAKRHPLAARRISLALGIIIFLLLCVYIYGCMTAPTDRMGRNLYIENVNVSGMTYDEALAAVQSEELLGGRNLTVTCAGQQYEINGVDIGLTPRIEDTVDKAMRYGKTDNMFINGLAETLQIFHRHTVAPSANVNEEVLCGKLAEFGKQIYGELVEHSLEIGDGAVICTPGYTGFDNNTDKAFEEVTNAINGNGSTWLSALPVTLSSCAPHSLTVDDVDNFVYSEPQNAYYAIENGTVVVMPEVPGRYIDRDLASELAAQVVEGGEQVVIPFSYSPAEITAETLQAKLFNATIGSYSTSYGTSTSNRCANIANAASRINGVVLLPGDVFSFNAAVGPRSAANGFLTAKEYVDGETVDGIGGGTCQVSSTLYNACIYSDLSIISRTSHMFPVGYCPLGQDATVAYGSVDYKFVNSMDYPIKISAVTSGYKITVSIIGTQRDDPRTVKVINTVAKDGENTRVTSVREVYGSSGDLISKDTLPGSYYKPHN